MDVSESSNQLSLSIAGGEVLALCRLVREVERAFLLKQ